MAQRDRQLRTERSESGFERLFREQYPIVHRIANGIVRDEHAAHDVAQDVFLAAQRRFPQPDASANAAGWVRIAATHLALNSIRAARRRNLRQARHPEDAAPSGPEELVVGREEADEVRRILARLPRYSATVLALRYSGLSYAEVADAMGVKVTAVGTMLRRAEERFRKEVERARR